MSASHGAPGELRVSTGDPAIDVFVTVTEDCELLVKMEGATWRLRFDPAEAAYVAGYLAVAAGVKFG